MKTKMRLFSGILAIMMLFFAVTESSIAAKAADAPAPTPAAVSANLVVKQKVDITSLFTKKSEIAKYVITDKDSKKLAKITAKGVLTAKKEGIVSINALGFKADKNGNLTKKADKNKVVETISVRIVLAQAAKKDKPDSIANIDLEKYVKTVSGNTVSWNGLDKLAKKGVAEAVAITTVSCNGVSDNGTGCECDAANCNSVSYNSVSCNHVSTTQKVLVIKKCGKVSLTAVVTNDLAQAKYDAAMKAAAGDKKAEKKAAKELKKSQAKYKVTITVKAPQFAKAVNKVKAGKDAKLSVKNVNVNKLSAAKFTFDNKVIKSVEAEGKKVKVTPADTAVKGNETTLVMTIDGYNYATKVVIK